MECLFAFLTQLALGTPPEPIEKEGVSRAVAYIKKKLTLSSLFLTRHNAELGEMDGEQPCVFVLNKADLHRRSSAKTSYTYLV